MAYTTEIKTAHGISFGGPVRMVSGLQGVLLWDGKQVDSTPNFYGTRARSKANLAVANMRRRYEFHLKTTGERLEIARRAAMEARQAAKKASTERRQAMTRDRLPMWNALKRLAAIAAKIDAQHHAGLSGDGDDWSELKDATNAALPFLIKHAQAAEDMTNDPQNERGGAVADKKPTSVLV